MSRTGSAEDQAPLFIARGCGRGDTGAGSGRRAAEELLGEVSSEESAVEEESAACGSIVEAGEAVPSERGSAVRDLTLNQLRNWAF